MFSGGMSQGQGVATVLGVWIVAFVVVVGVFLLLREFWCWYWKINLQVDLQRQILTELQASRMPAQPPSALESLKQDLAAGRITPSEFQARRDAAK